MLFLLCERSGKCMEENALGHHQGALPLTNILPEGDDKDISLLFSIQPEKAWWTRWEEKSKFKPSQDSLLVTYTHAGPYCFKNPVIFTLFVHNNPVPMGSSMLMRQHLVLVFLNIWKYLKWSHLYLRSIPGMLSCVSHLPFPKVSIGAFLKWEWGKWEEKKNVGEN